MIQAPPLSAIAPVRHGFFTRRGGVSDGIFASLNCGLGSSDRGDRVVENRGRVAKAFDLAPDRLVTVHQVHGTAVATATTPWSPADAPKADAVVSATPGIVLGILTADCAPILLADGEARVIGAAHAGWKGARSGVAEAALDAMETLGARRARVVAAIGPCIGADSYEVGPEFEATFLAEEPAAARFFRAKPAPSDRRLFDLAGYVAARLAAAGVAEVIRLGRDTLGETDDWFSYRRSCLSKEPDYGRQISAISLI